MLAFVPIATLLLWIAGGERGPSLLELPRGHDVATRSVMLFTALTLSASLLLCAWHRIIGLITLAGVLAAVAGFWPIVQQNKYSGPVLFEVRRVHGVHRNDLLALIPGLCALAALLYAVRDIQQSWLARSRTVSGIDQGWVDAASTTEGTPDETDV